MIVHYRHAFYEHFIKMEKVQIEHYQQHFTSQIQVPKFSPSELVSLLDKNLLQSIENVYRSREDGLDPLQFTRLFMNCLPHEESQSPAMAVGLAELFATISQGQSKVKFSHLTDYICQEIVAGETTKNQLQAKWIPIKSRQTDKFSYLSQPPIITGRSDQICKVWVDKQILDSGKHQDAISHACFSQLKNRIYCLESLADWIGVYTPCAKLQRKIKPSCFKIKKDSAVISISFSEKEERLGAILKDFSISFWDASDNYGFQKSINTTKYCQQFQNNIWYLQSFQIWLTADLEGKLYIWNLLQQQPDRIIKCKQRSKISDVCEIPSMQLLAVAQEQRTGHSQTTKIQLLSLSKGEVVTQIDSKFQRRLLHTLRFSQEYQILLSAGYDRKINLFELNQKYLDSTLKGQLLGHETVITCFNLVKKTPMVVSADDRGKVKVWNIKNFKCMQTLDFGDKVSITRVLDMGVAKKIALMGSRIIMLNLQSKPQGVQTVLPLKVKPLSSSLVLFTSHDLRTFCLKSGKLQSIDFQFSNLSSQISSFLFSSQGSIITGNDKGQIAFYCKNTGKLLQLTHWHSGSVSYLEEDQINGLMVSYSRQMGFVLGDRVNGIWEDVKQLKCNFPNKKYDEQVDSICLSAYHSFLSFIHQASVYLLDYQSFKLLHKLTFSSEQTPTCLAFVNGLSLLLIATSKGQIYVYQVDREQLTMISLVKGKEKTIKKLIVDTKICQKSKNKVEIVGCYIYGAYSDGSLLYIDYTAKALQLGFKYNKNTNPYSNPHRQVRQNLYHQLKKFSAQVTVNHQTFPLFQGQVNTLEGHPQGVTGLTVTKTAQNILFSTGRDNKIRVWKNARLVGDLNVNLPLPYLWNLEMGDQQNKQKRTMQGLSIIQMMFQRFGKDISIGQSQLFKNYSSNPFLTSAPVTQRKLKKKPTVFQEEFSPVDLNYDRIKKENIIPVGGPSLRRMEVTKKISNLQKQWQCSKEKQEHQKRNLLQNIMTKAQKTDQKDSILSVFKQRNTLLQDSHPKYQVGVMKILQQKLHASVTMPTFQSTFTTLTSVPKGLREQNLSKMICRPQKQHKKSLSKQTLQTYFNQRFTSGRMTSESEGSRSAVVSPQTSRYFNDRDICTSETSYKKSNNFRIMMKQMRQKVSKSKNVVIENPVLPDFSATTSRFSPRPNSTNSDIVRQLDRQINTFRIKNI